MKAVTTGVKFCAAFAVLICFNAVLAAAVPTDTEGKIDFVRRAVAHTLNSTVRAAYEDGDTRYEYDRGKLNLYDGGVYGDGTAYRLREIINPEIGSGSFHWYLDANDDCRGDVAIQRKFIFLLNYFQSIENIGSDADLDRAEILIDEDGGYRDVPCYRITINYPRDRKTIDDAPAWKFHYGLLMYVFNKLQRPIYDSPKFSMEDMGEYKDDYIDYYLPTFVLQVGKNPERPFIFSIRGFALDGTSMPYDEDLVFEFPASLDPGLFTLPPRAKILIADDWDGEREIRAEYYAKKLPPFYRGVDEDFAKPGQLSLSKIISAWKWLVLAICLLTVSYASIYYFRQRHNK